MSYSPYFLNQASQGTGLSTGSSFQNGSGSTLVKSTPVSVNTSSQLLGVDVSNEASVQGIVGLAGMDIPNSATGTVIDHGRLTNVITSFSIGDALYIAKNGSLTNIKPDIGIAGFLSGDFVVFVGVVVQNEFDVLQLDIKMLVSVIGQL